MNFQWFDHSNLEYQLIFEYSWYDNRFAETFAWYSCNFHFFCVLSINRIRINRIRDTNSNIFESINNWNLKWFNHSNWKHQIMIEFMSFNELKIRIWTRLFHVEKFRNNDWKKYTWFAICDDDFENSNDWIILFMTITKQKLENR